MKGFIQKSIRDEGGQAIVEYALALALAVAVVGIIGTGFRRTLLKVWLAMTKDIAAGCPGCPADSSLRF